MPALKPATIGQKLLTDFGQNRPLTTLGEKAKERLFAVVDDEITKLIIEDHSFMDNPGKRDVSEACERIIKEFDVYWSM